MIIHLSRDDVVKLSEGGFVKYEGITFKPSVNVMNICRRILISRGLLDTYEVVLESSFNVCHVYLIPIAFSSEHPVSRGRYHAAFFKDKEELDRFVDKLVDVLNSKGEITRADFRRLQGIKQNKPIYRETGWDSLNSLEIIESSYHGERGWKLILPPPRFLI